MAKHCEKHHCTTALCITTGCWNHRPKEGEKVTTKARQILITNYMPRGSWHLTWNPMSGAENFANLRNILWGEQRCIIPHVHLYNWIPQHYCEYHISISNITYWSSNEDYTFVLILYNKAIDIVLNKML